MEKQTGFLGISPSVWGVIGIVAILAGATMICALVALMFGLDAGLGAS
jgi:hypothetical protein